MGFKKILVAIDRSPQAPVVFEQALELAQNDESRLKVLYCLSLDTEAKSAPAIGTLADVDLYGTFHRVQRERLHLEIEKAKSWLEFYCQQATLRAIPTEYDCKVGQPNEKICEVARTWGADLIVLGRRGYKGISEIVLGSVSNYVLHHASCSVFVVQGVVEQTVDRPAATTQFNTSES
ncbi:MAG TPA: universal stress protein [Allocoleopsis sp.]